MASAAFDKSSVFQGGVSGIEEEIIFDGTIAAGAVVKDNTFPNVSLATGDPADWDATGDNKPIGVVKEDEATDINTAPASGTVGKMLPLGCGAIVRVELVTNSGNVTKGDKLYASATGGLVTPMIIVTAATPTVNEILAHHMSYVGRAMETKANNASDTQWIDVLLD